MIKIIEVTRILCAYFHGSTSSEKQSENRGIPCKSFALLPRKSFDKTRTGFEPKTEFPTVYVLISSPGSRPYPAVLVIRTFYQLEMFPSPYQNRILHTEASVVSTCQVTFDRSVVRFLRIDPMVNCSNPPQLNFHIE